MRRLLLSLFMLLALTGQALAMDANPEKARALVDGMAQEAISVLAAPNKTDEQIRTKFHDILQTSFDFDAIARFVLGRYWRVATPEQQAEYLKLFGEYVVGVYANRFKAYSGETISITSARGDGNTAIVTSKINLTGGQPPVQVEWKVEPDDSGKYRVTDVIIEQVSMSITQRSEFATIIQNNGGKVEALLALLRSRTASQTHTASSNGDKPG